MKKNIVIIVAVLAIASLVVYSAMKTSKVEVTQDISLEEKKECKTLTWQEEQPIYGTCIASAEIPICDDEPLNKSCSMQDKNYTYTCRTGTNTVQKSREECKEKEFAISVEDVSIKNYNLNYGDWGKCSYEADGEAAIITCDSKYDGDNNGICKPGESCIQFRITKEGVTRLVKNSQYEFTEEDESFFLEKLEVEELK
ncbi:hypothetical protein GOV09_05190 [Candidatus Woesearchaeota archaeon]|nr:hypothetical protein [Candidatus Woesearchaeota archaeon]